MVVMAKIVKSYRDLLIWQKSYSLALELYSDTRSLPPDENFGLRLQMRRAAVIIPSNIAEGWGRESRADYLKFLWIARGSCYELQTQVNLADDLRFMPAKHSLHKKN